MSVRNVIGAVLAGSLALGEYSQAIGQQTVVSLEQAVRQGQVEVEVLSLGGAAGSTVRVNVRRKAPQQEVHVSITPGTVFLSATGKVQNMTGGTLKGEFVGATNTYRPGSVMVLVDNNWHGYLIESFCLDYHKPAPRSGDKFSLAIHDERAMRILQAPQGVQVTPWAFQCAIWMDRVGVSATELKTRFGRYVTDVEINTARTLLRNAEQKGVAGIPAGIAPEVRKEAEKLFSSDPAVRAQAVDSLAKMGHRASPALPILAANVINLSADHHLPGTVVAVGANPREALEALETVGLPALKTLVREIKQRRGAAEETLDLEGLGGLVTDRAIAALKHRNAGTRVRAAAVLALKKDSRAVPPLIEALKDEDAQVRDRAAESLGKITGKDFGKDVEKWQQWWQENKATFQPAGAP